MYIIYIYIHLYVGDHDVVEVAIADVSWIDEDPHG